MATKLVRILAIRNRIISDIKHHMSIINEFSETTNPTIVKTRRRALSQSFNEFTQNWHAIEDLPDPRGEVNRTDLNVQNNALRDEYLLITGTLEEFENTAMANLTHHSTLHASLLEGRPSQFQSQIKLPPIKLRTFNGEFDDWEEFRDTFQACFTRPNEKEISDCQKFLYLKGVLGDEPLLLIKNLRATNDNYKSAWEILEKRYNNKRKIIYTHYRSILDMPPMSIESAQTLRSMLDTVNSSMAAIKIHYPDLGQLNEFIVFILSQKLDKESRKHWEEHLKASTELPQFNTFKSFLEIRFNILDGITSNAKCNVGLDAETTKSRPESKFKGKPAKTFLTTDKKPWKCTICPEDHRPSECPSLRGATIPERKQIIIDKHICSNCLYKHSFNECKSKFVCMVCQQKHHTLIHEQGSPEQTHTTLHVSPNTSALLATAQVVVETKKGEKLTLRALLDQGSSTNLITASVAKQLKTEFIPVKTPLLSIGNTQTATAQHKISLTIGSIHSKYQYATQALVIPEITEIRAIPFKIQSQWPHLQNIELADPHFLDHGKIDLLLGVEVHSEIILNGLIKGPKHTPIAQQSKIGWIISGSMAYNSNNQATCLFTHQESDDLNEQIKRFWQLDEIDDSKPMHTAEEKECEEHFVQHTTRELDGRYMVRLPFKPKPDSTNFIGNTHDIALRRFYSLEKRLNTNDLLKKEYEEYIQGYIDLNHIRPATVDEIIDTKNCYFMPHHAVWKESSTSTKLRVVFDASCKSNNGFSLNDRLLVGPTIQADLFTTILRWRQFPIAFTADITKMYRQFWVHPEDAKFQRILWRIDGKITQFLSQTVTFGTSSAPFQAVRLLHHIAKEVDNQHPLAADLLRNHFYVDDCVGGADTWNEAICKYEQLNSVLTERGLELRKWTSNSKQFLAHVPLEHQEKANPILLPEEQTIKALGIHWNPHTDDFSYAINLPEPKQVNTKRTYLSEFAMLFDPLGWLAPCLVIPKILLQHIWVKGIGWDDPLPEQINEKWVELREQFKQLKKIRISRWLGMSSSAKNLSLHGYADASEQAIAAVIYLRTEHQDGSITSEIITGKTKVTPIKRVSLPRLELNAAHLLAKIIAKIRTLFPPTTEIRLYTDSTITLCWISSHPSKWKTYVANRITLIQEIAPAEHWTHIRSKENPADCASRGLFPMDLCSYDLWWHGPKTLLEPRETWKTNSVIKKDPEKHEEMKTQHKFCFTINIEFIDNIASRFSSLEKLLRVTSYCLRFKRRIHSEALVTTAELEEARKTWIKIVQMQYFNSEIKSLLKNQNISPKSKILSLSPMLDSDQILRLRGRLQNAHLPYEQQHPVILPAKGHFTWLIIDQAHRKTFHGGTQLTTQYTRQQYWILNARNTVRRHIHLCVRCFRYNQIAAKQLMGSLPSPRVTQHFPFTHTGVDFAGYFEVKTSILRQAPYVKCYVSLFVCLTTKAIHLELVEDLTTQAFLAAFRRFAARRGLPAHIYSDNATNFVGACNEMPRLLTNILSKQRAEVANCLSRDGTQWHFIPPHSPHFGGLWEAGVKSMKHHLKRVLGETRLRHGIFNTILTQIEAVLNSRPLCQLTADPEDTSSLTPGHFLIGRPLTLMPEPDIRSIPVNRLDIYQTGQQIVQHFWHQWSKEYLQRLQERPKWTQPAPNLEVGQIVIIQDDNLPPGKWLLGKITKTIQGEDGLVRVVDLKCHQKEIRRSIKKLRLLPITDNN